MENVSSADIQFPASGIDWSALRKYKYEQAVKINN